MIIFRILTLIPFLGVMVAIYAAMVFVSGDMGAWLASSAFTVDQWPSAAQANLVMSNGDMLVLIGLFALALEMIKATNTRGFSLGNHGLSMLVFVIALFLLILGNGYATVTFLLLTAMSLVDVLVGMLVTIVTARRDIGLGGFDAG
jgi:hypothetical protein